MRYLIYLKRSMQRRRWRHLSLLIILMCAMILPLIVSIYRSSNIYGMKMQTLNATKGYDYHLKNAQEKHLDAFRNIEGISKAVFEDGTIYLAVSPEFSRSDETDEKITIAILRVLDKIGYASTNLFNFFLYGQNESNQRSEQHMRVLNGAVIALSLLIVSSSYNSHLRFFRQEIETLRAIGATRAQIMRMFWAEILLLFVPAALGALLLTSGLMRFLFHQYLQIRDIPTLSWAIFHIDTGAVLTQLLIFFIALSAMVFVQTHRFVAASLHKPGKARALLARAKRRRAIRERKKTELFLASLLLKRVNRVPFATMCILVPVLIVFLFTLQYLTINIDAISVPPEYEIRISSYNEEHRESLLTDEQIDAIQELEGVSHLKKRPILLSAAYVVPDQRMRGSSVFVTLDGQSCAPTVLRCYSQEYPDAKERLRKYEVVAEANHAYLAYKAGDSLVLQPTRHAMKDGDVPEGEPFDLRVVATADLEWSENALTLFLSDELYHEIMEGIPVGDIGVCLNEPSSHEDVFHRLQSTFPTIADRMVNHRQAYELLRNAVLGTLIMYGTMFGTMLLFLWLIVWVRIWSYLQENKALETVLCILGMERRTLQKAYRIQLSIDYALGTFLAFAAAYILLALFFSRTGYYLQFSPIVIAIQLAVVLLLYAAFRLPLEIYGKKHFMAAGSKGE